MLGHGAGGSVDAPDLRAAARVALDLGWTVVSVEQPYKVAGKRSPPVAAKLDAAWLTVLEALDLGDGPLVVGGRSSGARVACRTAGAAGAAGVLCLAFPLIPPGGPSKTRAPELDAVEVPVLIVQGTSDRFGMPEPAPDRQIVAIRGDHGLKSDLPAVADAVRDWLAER